MEDDTEWLNQVDNGENSCAEFNRVQNDWVGRELHLLIWNVPDPDDSPSSQEVQCVTAKDSTTPEV